MANLIQLTKFDTGQPIIVNADHIVSIHREDDARKNYTEIGTVTGAGFIKVCEDIFTVAKRIQAQP